MKKSIVILILLFIAGCAGFNNPSEIKIRNQYVLRGIKNWNISFDSTRGYNKPYGTLVINETAFTDYKDVNSVPNRPSPEYLFADLRGKRLSGNIIRILGEKGMKLPDDADGKIIISRPTFLNEGRYILRTYITFFDKDNKEIAVIDVFNNLRKEITSGGIRYADTGEILDDNRFAEICVEKILSVLDWGD